MLERIGGGAWKLKEPEEVPGLYEENEELPVFDEARTWLDGYFLEMCIRDSPDSNGGSGNAHGFQRSIPFPSARGD